jgi:hypothetical protein
MILITSSDKWNAFNLETRLSWLATFHFIAVKTGPTHFKILKHRWKQYDEQTEVHMDEINEFVSNYIFERKPL